MKLMYRTKPTQNFTDLVKRCSDQNLTVRRYARGTDRLRETPQRHRAPHHARRSVYRQSVRRGGGIHRRHRKTNLYAAARDGRFQSQAHRARVRRQFSRRGVRKIFGGTEKEPARLPRRKTGGDPQSLYLNGKTVRVIAKRGRTSPRISTIPAAAIFWTKPNWETIGLWERTPISSKCFRRLKPKST